MLRLFKGTGPGVIILIILTLALLWVNSFIRQPVNLQSFYEEAPMPLYSILKLFFGVHYRAALIFMILLTGGMALLLVSFNTSVFFINERTFLPALFYILFSSLFPSSQVLNPVLPASLFLMLALIRIMDSYRKQGLVYNFFDAGILIGTGALFYAGMIWFAVLIIAGMVLLRPGSLTEIIAALAGLLAPFLVLAGVWYLADRQLSDLFILFKENLFGEAVQLSFDRITVVICIVFAALTLLSTVFLLSAINSKKIRTRKTFYLLFWMLFISISVYFLLEAVSVELMWIVAIPVSYLLSNYFVFAKNKYIPELLFSLVFMMLAGRQVFEFIQLLHH
jgi:hypothetical protein